MRTADRLIARRTGRVGARPMIALAAMLGLVACHSARQAPGMDPNELSDDRGAHAGRFVSPADNAAAAANDTDPAGNGTTVENSQ